MVKPRRTFVLTIRFPRFSARGAYWLYNVSIRYVIGPIIMYLVTHPTGYDC